MTEFNQVANIKVFGVGGGGCVVAELLARIGVGYLKLIDGDVFEESNANRQIGCTMDVLGQSKPIVMKNRLENIIIRFISNEDNKLIESIPSIK